MVASPSDESDADELPARRRPTKASTKTQSTLRNGIISSPRGNASTGSNPSSAQPSPSKPKRPARNPQGAHQSPQKDISYFFSNAIQRQQSQNAVSPEKTRSFTKEDEDYIEDDDITVEDVDELERSLQPPPGSKTALTLRKRGRGAFGDTSSNASNAVGGSQKFLKSIQGTKLPAASQSTGRASVDDGRPWTDKYGPVNLEELAVHKKKVAEVRTWLQDVFCGRDRRRILLLKGPAGSGKSTTISLLSRDSGFVIQEWKNPSGSLGSTGSVSYGASFDDFLGRTAKFGSLHLDVLDDSEGRSDQSTADSPRQLVLVEEFPASLTHSSSALQSFRKAILQFLAANVPSLAAFSSSAGAQPVVPIVIIVSETLLTSSSASADSFTAHRLLGSEILHHPGVTTIEYNPIAPTFLTKALELVIVKEARKSGRRRTPGPQVINRLAEGGDVRSSVSVLEFLCVQGDSDGWGAKVAFTKSKRSSNNVPLTDMEKRSLAMISERESALGIFHSVGKVVYNKRTDQGGPPPQPPNFLPHLRRPKASDVDVNRLIDELGTDTQTFVSALHENYILSCERMDMEDTMDSINGCIDALSDADILSPDRFGLAASARRKFQSTGIESLRQDEISFHVSVRGLHFALPSPVKRTAAPGSTVGRGRGAASTHQMLYPTSLKLWRVREEIEGLVDLWVSRAQNGFLIKNGPEMQGLSKSSRPGGVEAWQNSSRSFSNGHQDNSRMSSTASSDPDTTSPSCVLVGSSRQEMVLERLPYVAAIHKRSLSPFASLLKEIEKVTVFKGVGTQNEEEPEDDDTMPDAPSQRQDQPASLVLSDDDIED
ncbi:Rad17 cell cycle checkpoint protein-domain-containing protein [Lineolata rhizophorae]|uniref:Rad17 cell cycle checkpoint protein-domain-containing protein n=1 Tax=Lineolata rhizophorae TaxID=578093 RepID=A0A6A6P806_9PEZI|nr:Rad17 cell cycle checkpoint protein-domain-containing protein [Lineolata rhizophorae]